MARFHLSFHAEDTPDRTAAKLMPSGQQLTFKQLDEQSNQAAHLLRSKGLKRGDVIAILMENCLSYLVIATAAERAGIYFTGVSSRLTPPEVAYIVEDSGAQLLFTTEKLADIAAKTLESTPQCSGIIVDSARDGFESYHVTDNDFSKTPISDQSPGAAMLYSSGTTGRPKGVRFDLDDEEIGYLDNLTALVANKFEMDEQTIYLMPAPMYHAAALRWGLSILKVGGTLIVMERYDAEHALQLIEKEKITHSQWVPTHFIRMLKLPEEVRNKYDVSSQQFVFHAAAPCPIPVKQDMIDWWGPIIYEYYAGTEFNGMTLISPEEWLAHPGSVGQAIFGTVHIMSDDGETELPVGEEGLIYYEGGTEFSYHNDPEKTASAYNSKGWSSLGDIGRLDEDGYLYLTDRKAFMIISGGVNIYPQEIEDAIIVHPKVADVAVISAPDDDLGERVVAVIQPLDWNDAGDDMTDEIKTWLRERLSGVKMPKQFDYRQELPRHPTGKLYKRLLKDEYHGKAKA